MLAKLGGGGPEAAHALRPYLDDDSLLAAHLQILNTIAATGAAGEIRLDSIIRGEESYLAYACREDLNANWDREFGQPPALHYLRLISALKAIRALGIKSDLGAVREFFTMTRGCRHLTQQQDLEIELAETLLPAP